MGRFDNPPPCKSKIVSIPGWEEFGEVVVWQVGGVAAQDLIDLVRSAAKVSDDPSRGNDIEQNAKAVSLCVTIAGEAPPLEWLRKVPFGTLKYIVGFVMDINSLSPDSGEELEKN